MCVWLGGKSCRLPPSTIEHPDLKKSSRLVASSPRARRIAITAFREARFAFHNYTTVSRESALYRLVNARNDDKPCGGNVRFDNWISRGCFWCTVMTLIFPIPEPLNRNTFENYAILTHIAWICTRRSNFCAAHYNCLLHSYVWCNYCFYGFLLGCLLKLLFWLIMRRIVSQMCDCILKSADSNYWHDLCISIRTSDSNKTQQFSRCTYGVPLQHS